MQLTSTLLLPLLAVPAFAVPTFSWPPWPFNNHGGCLSLSTAETIVGYYAAVIAHNSTSLGNATQTAYAITVPNYTEYSDSASEQVGAPLNVPITTSQAVFAAESQSNPPADFTTLGVYTVECNKILWRWVQYGDGGNASAIPVKGFHLFELNYQNLLELTYFEFNGLAAAIDTHEFGCHS